MKTLNYKGYTAEFVIDLDANVLHGRVLGLQDVITFQGDTVAEAIQAYHDSIDDYLEFCAERGEEPERPFSGKVHFRATPELHRRMVLAASQAGLSLNTWMEEALSNAVDRTSETDSPSTTVAESSATAALPDIGHGYTGMLFNNGEAISAWEGSR